MNNDCFIVKSNSSTKILGETQIEWARGSKDIYGRNISDYADKYYVRNFRPGRLRVKDPYKSIYIMVIFCVTAHTCSEE